MSIRTILPVAALAIPGIGFACQFDTDGRNAGHEQKERAGDPG